MTTVGTLTTPAASTLTVTTCSSTVGDPTTRASVAPAPLTSSIVVYGRSASTIAPSGRRTASWVNPSSAVREHDQATVEERVAGLAEDPLREPNVPIDVDHRLAATVGRPPVQAPEARAITEEPQ